MVVGIAISAKAIAKVLEIADRMAKQEKEPMGQNHDVLNIVYKEQNHQVI